jgi:hypothetical protein
MLSSAFTEASRLLKAHGQEVALSNAESWAEINKGRNTFYAAVAFLLRQRHLAKPAELPA